jgi:5-methylcytosine-specific restriction endonuclease McrA
MEIDGQIKKQHRKRTIPMSLKAAVWNEYIGENVGATLCPICKNNKITQMNFVCGHVEAESKGGALSLENLRPICGQCNLSMGTKNLNDFQEEYFNSTK